KDGGVAAHPASPLICAAVLCSRIVAPSRCLCPDRVISCYPVHTAHTTPTNRDRQFSRRDRMTATAYTTAQLQELDSAHHLHPRTNLKQLAEHGPLVLERGQGVYVWDTDDKRYIDAVAGLWCVNVGHGRKEL